MITIKRKLHENSPKRIIFHFHVEGCEPCFLKTIFEENRKNILEFGEVYAKFVPDNVFEVVIYKHSLDHDPFTAEHLKSAIKSVTEEVGKIKKELVDLERATDISNWIYEKYNIKTLKEPTPEEPEEPIKFVPEKIVFPTTGELDWGNVPEGARIMVWDNSRTVGRYLRPFSRCNPFIFADGGTSSGNYEKKRKKYAVPVDRIKDGKAITPLNNWVDVRIDTPLLVWEEKKVTFGNFAKCDIIDSYGSYWDNAILVEDRFNVDWEKVAVDTKIIAIVENGEFLNWRNGFFNHYLHFAKYENGKVFAFCDGKTSDCVSSPDDVIECPLAMLATSEY